MPTQRERLSAIADAIREKTGGSSPIVASSFPEAIRGITTAVPRVVGPSTVTPDDSSFEGAWQAAMAATGYWNAKASDTRVIAYSDGDGCLKPGGVVNDSEGRAVMDCSTYMGLVLRGLGYLASPYGTKLAANATVDPADVVASAEWWCEPDVDRQTDARCSDLGMRLGSAYRAITASDICRWLECQGLTWSPGERAPRVGDLCFFSKQDADGTLHYPQRWRGVSHVGIMVGPDHYLNVTDYPQSGHLIRTDVGTRPPELYGRPLWGGLSRGGGGDLSANSGNNLLPGLWSGVRQGSSQVSGAALTCDGLSLAISGRPSSALVLDLVQSGCPLCLPAGTYRISGVKNDTGTNTVSATHSLWGLRVYESQTGAGIPGTTRSSNGANSSQRTPVWDIGGGGEFTLASQTLVRVDFYGTSSRDLSGISVDARLERVG